MKKLKKKNKKQVEKKKWSAGLTVASVIGGVALVSGATVLGVYLTGGFLERVVNPQSIDFEYDESLFNNGRLEISGVESFSLKITTPTQNVTRKKISLSFQGVDYSKANGYISNGIIQVPETLEIGKPFTVTLLQKTFAYDRDGDGENDLTFDCIAGGISTLYATSEYNQIDRQSLTIAVDTPVYEIENYIVDANGNAIDKVGAGKEFKIASKFYPQESRYMFGDPAREKLVLFGVTDGINYIKETKYDNNFGVSFTVGNEIVNDIKIKAFAFKNAKTQLELIDSLNSEDSVENKYSDLYGKLSVKSGENVSNGDGLAVKMASASISSFDIAQKGNISILEGERGTIYVNKSDSLSLGARVTSTEDEILTYMLENVALEFVKTDGSPLDMTDSSLMIYGREKNIDGHKVFLPLNDVSNKNNCYWDIQSSLTQDIKVNVYLLVQEGDGNEHFFKVGDVVQVKTFTLQTREVEDEQPTFIGQDPISFNVPQKVITLDILNNTINPTTINLRDFISIPEGNKYKGVVFYVKAVGEGDIADIIQGPFNGVDDRGRTKIIGDSITIHGAGSFTLEFATTKPDGSIVKICEGVKTFVCQQALSRDSIIEGETEIIVQQAGNVIPEGDAYLSQMEGDSITLTYSLASASANVFADEFNAGKISLDIFAGSEDITSSFMVLPQMGTTDLVYTLKVLGEPEIEKKITQFALSYKKDESGENDIVWRQSVPIVKNVGGEEPQTGASITIYSPTTQKIEITNAPKRVSYNQILTTEGFNVTITALDQDTQIPDLIEAIIGVGEGNILITDQHGREDTLAGKWAFVIESDADNIINLETKTFSIKSTGSATIKIKATVTNVTKYAQLEGGDDYALTINADATGVDHLTYQNGRLSTEVEHVSGGSVVSQVEVEKYGVQNAVFNMSELVKYYLDSEENEQYTKITYKFSSSYFINLTQTQIIQLYGKNGILEVYSGETLVGEDIDSTQTDYAQLLVEELERAVITRIQIKDNFGTDHTIKLDITDENQVINTSFSFKLLSNINIDVVDYDNNYCANAIELTNNISYKEGGETLPATLGGIFDQEDKIWYVVLNQNASTYRIVEEAGDHIATITNGKINFLDFFDRAEKSFSISFGEDNAYKRNLFINFKVKRNAKVVTLDKKYYLVNNDNSLIANYLEIQRIVGNQPISGSNFDFVTDGTYLTIEGDSLKQNSNVVLDYNEQYLTQKLYVKCGDDFVGDVDIRIELAEGVELYSHIAQLLQSASNEDNKASRQRIKNKNGDEITYLVLDTKNGDEMMWKFQGNLADTETLLVGNSACYKYNGSAIFTLQSQESTLAGLDNQNYYLILKVKQEESVIEIRVPIIISKVGASPIIYTDSISLDQTLATALMRGDEFVELANFEYIMLSANAGQKITLDKISRYVNGQTFIYDDIGSERLLAKGLSVLPNKAVLKGISLGEYPQISLNHLSDEVAGVYLPFAWVVGDQTFYYLVKVVPDVSVEEPIYAYDGVAEYISCQPNESYTIDFHQTYSENTLHEGNIRFNVIKKGEIQENITSSLTQEYYIKSVKIGNNTYTNALQWQSDVEFIVQGHSITIIPKKNNPMTILIGVRYSGGTSESDLAVIGEDKIYTIILNQDTKNYKVRIAGEVQDNYEWTLDNVGGGARELKIELLDVNATTGEINSIVHNQLKVTAIDNIGDIIQSYAYNPSGELNEDIEKTTLRLNLKDYISEDKTFKFAVYTEYGYLATINVDLRANAVVSANKTSLEGGVEHAFGDIFAVSLDNTSTSAYSVERIEFTSEEGDCEAYISASATDKTITIKDLFEDKNVVMSATIKFGEDKKYTFTQNLTLVKNVTTKLLASKNVIAGKDITLQGGDFVNGGTTPEISCLTTEGITHGEGAESSQITINPNNVGVVTPITLKLKITLSSGQSRTVDYTINVYPAVKLDVTYPKPSDTILDREYIKTNQSYSSINEFLNGACDYAYAKSEGAKNSRIILSQAEENDGVITYKEVKAGLSDFKVTLSQCNNAILSQNGKTLGQGSSVDVGADKEIIFARGTYGATSLITFMLTVEGVSVSYTVEVREEVYQAQTNYQTNNIEAGEYLQEVDGEIQTTPVTLESLYLDQTNFSGLFEQGRMLKIQTSSNVVEGAYRFVFKKGEEYYVSQNVTILATDKDKLMTYDLGTGMLAKGVDNAMESFVGVFNADSISDENNFVITDWKLTEKTPDALAKLENYKERFFNLSHMENKLVSRIHLTYGGHEIDFNKYASQFIKDDAIKISNNTFGDINAMVALSAEGKYSFSYYFKANLDVKVDANASSRENFINAEVNIACSSIVEKFGIAHASTGKKLIPSEFNSNRYLSYTIVGKSDTTDMKNFNAQTNNKYADYDFKKTTASGDYYLQIEVGKRNAESGVYDFEFLPLGAKNEGDFVLTKLSYIVKCGKTTLSQDFFIVIKIQPDYQVKFNDIEDGIEEEEGSDTILANSQSMIEVSEIEGNCYKTFYLLADDDVSENGFLSIKHKHGINAGKNIASNFSITLTQNMNDYNHEINLASKLGLKQADNRELWTYSDGVYTFNKFAFEFVDVPKVVFGEQKFCIDGTDAYGYKVRLYFALALVDGTSPSQYSSTAISIKEGEGVDITSRYEMLTISKGETKEEKTTLSISSVYNDPVVSEEGSSLNLIELTGISAYGFDNDYTENPEYLKENYTEIYTFTYSSDILGLYCFNIQQCKIINTSTGKSTIQHQTIGGEGYFSSWVDLGTKVDDEFIITDIVPYSTATDDPAFVLNINKADGSADAQPLTAIKNSTGYSLNSRYVFAEKEMEKYLALPTLHYVTVDRIRIQSQSGELLADSNKSTGVSTIRLKSNSSLATTEGQFYHSGFTSRGASTMFVMPQLNSNIYGASTTARVTLYIDLKYANGENVEVCTVPISVQAVKQVNFLDNINYKVVRDDKKFSVSNIFKLDTSSKKIIEYLNDTLEVKVKANTTFEFKLTYNGSTTVTKSISNVGWSYDKTYYLSISEMLGRNVINGLTVRLEKISGSGTFAYISASGVSSIKDYDTFSSFKIAQVRYDKLQVDDASQLTHNAYYMQDKYYLAGVGTGTSSDAYYRVTKSYYVTGKYFSVRNNDTSEVSKVLSKGENTFVDDWAVNLEFVTASCSENGINSEGYSYASNKIGDDELSFEIDETQSVGVVEIDAQSGVITVKDDFTVDYYVTINIYQKVSGNGSLHYLGSVRLTLK